MSLSLSIAKKSYSLFHAWLANLSRVSSETMCCVKNNSISFFNNSKNQNIITLNDVDIEDEIRTSIISNHVSRVAQIERIRNYVFEIQKKNK